MYTPTKGEKCYDLSAWQGELSADYFKGIKGKGVSCVILRSSYTSGDATFKMGKDKYFDHNIKNAIKAGMHIGIYHFSQAKTETEAKKEAEFCLKVIKPYMESIDLPVAHDWESYKRLSAAIMKKNGKTKNTAIIHAFCDTVKNAGYEPMVYASLVVFNNYLNDSIYKELKIWVAQYYTKCEYKHQYYMWQFTSNNGKLDENVFGTQGTKKKDSILPIRGFFKRGDKGDDVKTVQQMLIKANAGAHWTIAPDGDYGEKTEKFVKLFQDARHLTIDGEFGFKSLEEAKKKVTLQMRAINRGVSVARSKNFCYGVGKRAHRYGDPFSGTNAGPVLKKKEKKGEPHYVNANGEKWEQGDGTKYTYENTMCCNPFVSMCYAYGATVKSMLKAVQKGSGGGTSPNTWTRYGFKKIGKVKNLDFGSLEMGDVIIISKKGKLKMDHCYMYTGGDWLVEASSEGWGLNTIQHKKGAKSRFKKYQADSKAYVMRYPES